MGHIITKARLKILVEAVAKQGLKPLGPTFCEDYGIEDFNLMYETNDKKAEQIILNRYADFEDPWGQSH